MARSIRETETDAAASEAIESKDRRALLALGDEDFDPYAERILDAARRELLEHGLRRTSLDQVARAAEVSRATLFRRFPNRDALVFALAAREARGAIARVDEQVAEIDDAEDFMVTGALGVIHEITGNGLLQRLLVTDAEQILPLLTSRSGPILLMGREYIAGHLRRLRKSGAILSGDLDVLAELLARMTLSLAVNRQSLIPLDDDEQLSRVVRGTIVPLLLGAPGPG
ncbi:MAG: TetR/AcrR family transcriptional regulator [Solirubrobacterales bacterium]|nr:TetR/AcrR family transcriptional regulator [Solirubrobacterales bacterium]